MAIWRQRNGRAGWLLKWLRDLNLKICPGCKSRELTIELLEAENSTLWYMTDADKEKMKANLKQSEDLIKGM